MKLTTGIVALAIAAGTAWAQNPAIIQNTKNALQGVQQQKTAASNAALQTTSPAKPSGAVPARPGTTPVQATSTKPAATPMQPAPTKPAVKVVPVKTSPAPAQAPGPVKVQAQTKTPAPVKTEAVAMPKTAKISAKPAAKVAAHGTAAPKTPVAPQATAEPSREPEASKPDKLEDKKYSMTGKRDPFISPVVNRQSGSGCSTGKKCLDIEQIALHGVVKSDNGMIAVVTNGLNKAYFLRENDPVFNGYVVKITVDSIVFKETFQDRLGKPFTKDVVKRILTPAV